MKDFEADNVSVKIVQEHARTIVYVTTVEGDITAFVIKAEAAHVGCAGLRVREAYGEVGEEEWLNFAVKRMV